jgi:NAD(P)-dependent dehydrogenase (short-subunit alcohol dehydrogenase family)
LVHSELQTNYLDRMRLDGRVFVVLGAGQGIGRETSHALAQAGARVACVDRAPGLAERVAGEIDGLAVTGDVTAREDMERMFSEVLAATGHVDGVVDIVGMNVAGTVKETDDAAWRQQFAIVLDHAFLALQVGGAAVAASGGGAIVFVGSIAGTVTTGLKHAAYGAAKAGLHQLVAYAGKELAPDGVRVNAVAPGVTLTPRSVAKFSVEQREALAQMIPAGRPGEVPEIASAILFLASDLASYVTGQVLAVDGGLSETLRMDLL